MTDAPKTRLANVLEAEDPERGPDVCWGISVPASWSGAELRLTLPRRLLCARCEGGGCDVCGRSGAIALYAPDAVPAKVEFCLSQLAEGGAVRVRLRGYGATERAGQSPGHLLLEVREGPTPTSGVECRPSAFGGGISRHWPVLLFTGLLVVGLGWWLAR